MRNPAAAMRISDIGLAFIKQWEGLRLHAYECKAGKWTIGYGHTRTAREGMVITREQARELLDRDIAEASQHVRDMVKVPLTQHQFDALVSFVFNLGPTAFRRSTLLRKLNQGSYAAVPGQLGRWVFARQGGRAVRSDGLANRRAAEAGLWARDSHVASAFVEAEEEPPPPVLATNTGKATIATGAAGLIAVLLAALGEVGAAVDAVYAVPGVAELPALAGAALVLATVAGVLFWRARRNP